MHSWSLSSRTTLARSMHTQHNAALMPCLSTGTFLPVEVPLAAAGGSDVKDVSPVVHIVLSCSQSVCCQGHSSFCNGFFSASFLVHLLLLTLQS